MNNLKILIILTFISTFESFSQEHLILDSYSKDGYRPYNNLSTFDLNINAYERFYIRNNSKSATRIIYFDENLNVLDSNKYLPMIGQRSYSGEEYFFAKEKLYDKKVYFNSSLNPNQSFTFYKPNGVGIEGTRSPFINGVLYLKNSFINLNGDEVLKDDAKMDFESNEFISNHIVVRYNENSAINNLNFINIKGDKLSNQNFYSARPFSEGLAEVCIDAQNPKYGYINDKGNLVIPYKFSQTSPFKYGYAKVTEIISMKQKVDWKGVLNYVPGVSTSKTEIKERTYFIDKTGNEVKNITFSKSTKILPLEGLFVFSRDVEKGISKENQIIKKISPTIFETLSLDEKKVISKAEQGILNKEGKVLYSVESGLSIYQGDPTDGVLILKKDFEDFAYIWNGNDELIKIPNYNFFTGFHNGLAMVIKETGRQDCPLSPNLNNQFPNSLLFCENQIGFINMKGELQIPYSIRGASNFAKDRALIIKNNLKYALIDKNGNEIKGGEQLNR